ncbi:Kdo domain containing protein [Marixanthomonas sp. SCSIO 43207]|uniref:lipopolysaccharide kinase InaA family protein n=1 Tax=Marixanthomonas sp. SCSIO 43207 TaxID=2779360 RepID=UPI001CA9FF70|nr:lipopolysaccharide kinase InaA family protein [Marixanthomonas sp. SCSIO 43207]UAB81084.1 Kdo domain containing protein [Marixanthomonas sp. SCSIO 43207]
MKMFFSEKYKPQKKSILEILDSFENQGENLGRGDRNVIKIFPLNNEKINIKSFKVPNFINKVVYNFFRKSKAARSFEHATYLIKQGIGTPYPIAYLEEENPLFFGKSYYISEQLDADCTFRALIENPNYPDREQILREFTAFTHMLHENRILFKDHSPGNTLIKKEGNQFNFYLVDLNRMEFKSLSFEERIKNYSRLTSKKEMVAIMSDEYAKITGQPYDKVFTLMWGLTSKFQKKFYRKKRLKQKLKFK